MPGELSARDLLCLPGVVRQEETAPGEGTFEEIFVSLVDEALAGLRRRACARRRGSLPDLQRDSSEDRRRESRASTRHGPGSPSGSRRLCRSASRSSPPAFPLDEARLAQEVALLADRADITEEIDRLKAHLVEARRLLAAGGAVGRRLDHLAQELHREVNTSGAKVREVGATQLVLDLKSDLEAFKEQVQNVE